MSGQATAGVGGTAKTRQTPTSKPESNQLKMRDIRPPVFPPLMLEHDSTVVNHRSQIRCRKVLFVSDGVTNPALGRVSGALEETPGMPSIPMTSTMGGFWE
jgi:hypothetical protein